MSLSPPLAQIIRTERGLSISGTRITLYDVMDYVLAQYPAHFIQSLLGLTTAQVEVALDYIDNHREAVEAEYKTVLHKTEEHRHYWEKRKREHLAQVTQQSSRPEHVVLWKKLQAQKAKHAIEA